MRLAGATEADIESYRRADREKAKAEMSKRIAALGGGDLVEGVGPGITDTDHPAKCWPRNRHDRSWPARGGFTNERLLGSVARNVPFQATCDVFLAP